MVDLVPSRVAVARWSAIRLFGLDDALHGPAQSGAAEQYRDRQGAACGPGERCLFAQRDLHSGLQQPVRSKNRNKRSPMKFL